MECEVRARKILLIDDHEDFVSTLAERLRLRGFRADTATGIEEALDLMNDMSPDVIVFDVLLGVDYLRQFIMERPDTPIIIFTDMGQNRPGEEGIRLGARACLMKPFAIEDLLDAINESLH
jgi:DNA-binding response OmpR family regulator